MEMAEMWQAGPSSSEWQWHQALAGRCQPRRSGTAGGASDRQRPVGLDRKTGPDATAPSRGRHRWQKAAVRGREEGRKGFPHEVALKGSHNWHTPGTGEAMARFWVEFGRTKYTQHGQATQRPKGWILGDAQLRASQGNTSQSQTHFLMK